MQVKFTIKRITDGEDEVVLKYRQMSSEVERIINFFNSGQRLKGQKQDTIVIIELSKLLYIESVDAKTFAYTEKDVLRVDYTLNRLEQILCDINFFRCSKSMIINIDKVESLKSLPSNRIEATMCNGERIMISRTYASDFRKRLKGGADNE